MLEALEELEKLEALERLETLEKLDALERLEALNKPGTTLPYYLLTLTRVTLKVRAANGGMGPVPCSP